MLLRKQRANAAYSHVLGRCADGALRRGSSWEQAEYNDGRNAPLNKARAVRYKKRVIDTNEAGDKFAIMLPE